MNAPTFHSDRMTGVGGSDTPALLGLSTYKTALDVFMEKRGLTPPAEETQAMRWGKLLEPVVRQEYAERTGRTVTLPLAMLRHEKYPFVIGHPDGLVVGEQRGYEGKIARSGEGWGEQGTDQVPEAYLLQAQHYMVLTAFPVWDLAVLVGNMDFRIYEIPADAELQGMIIEAAADFWKHVDADEAPEPDWESPLTLPALRKLYAGTNGMELEADESQVRWYEVMREADERAKSYSTTADAAKAHLLHAMKQAAILKFPDGKALRRKETKRKGYIVADTTYMDARIINSKE